MASWLGGATNCSYLYNKWGFARGFLKESRESDAQNADCLWPSLLLNLNLLILELLAKGNIAGGIEPTTYRMLSCKLHAVPIFELIGDTFKTFGI
jgi:hypothetical protein